MRIGKLRHAQRSEAESKDLPEVTFSLARRDPPTSLGMTMRKESAE